MTAIFLLAAAFVVWKVVVYLAIVLVDGLATAIAVYYRWRSARLGRLLLANRPIAGSASSAVDWTTSRVQRRLMARHLRLSLAMTAHYSLFPRSTARGSAIADTWLGQAQ